MPSPRAVAIFGLPVPARGHRRADHPKAPHLLEALTGNKEDDLPHLDLNGTLLPTDRLAERTREGNYGWYSGNHEHFGGNIQSLTKSTGFSLWNSPVKLGSTHDIPATPEHCLGALYPATAAGLAPLADCWLAEGQGSKCTPRSKTTISGGQPCLRRAADWNARHRQTRHRTAESTLEGATLRHSFTH